MFYDQELREILMKIEQLTLMVKNLEEKVNLMKLLGLYDETAFLQADYLKFKRAIYVYAVQSNKKKAEKYRNKWTETALKLGDLYEDGTKPISYDEPNNKDVMPTDNDYLCFMNEIKKCNDFYDELFHKAFE